MLKVGIILALCLATSNVTLRILKLPAICNNQNFAFQADFEMNAQKIRCTANRAYIGNLTCRVDSNKRLHMRCVYLKEVTTVWVRYKATRFKLKKTLVIQSISDSNSTLLQASEVRAVHHSCSLRLLRLHGGFCQG